MKTRTTISVDKDVLNKIKNYGINISQFCEEEMTKLLEILESDSDVAEKIREIQEQKQKLELGLYRLYKIEMLKQEIKKGGNDHNKEIWIQFIQNFENWYYGFNEIDVERVEKATGLHETQLRTLGEFIYSYNDVDELKLNTDLDYAIMRYNQNNKSAQIMRDTNV